MMYINGKCRMDNNWVRYINDKSNSIKNKCIDQIGVIVYNKGLYDIILKYEFMTNNN